MNTIQTVALMQTYYTVPPVVHAVQNDSGRQLKMAVKDETVPSGSTATLSIHRSDDTHYDISTTEESAGVFVADITQALTQAGECRCQLKVAGIVSTYTFVIDVQKDESGTVTPQEGQSIEQAVAEALSATGAFVEEQVSGASPTINAEINHRYICGEVTSLSFTPSTDGIVAVVFESGATPTVLNLPETVLMPEWYEVEANTLNEINISDGIYGAVMVWAR